MNLTGIQWTNWSANPLKLELPNGARVNACVKISPGCLSCYAESVTRRWWKKKWGAFPGYIKALLKIGKPVLIEDELKAVLRLSARIAAGKADPAINKIFWNDVTDEYLDFWPDEFLDKIWAVRALTPNLIHQVLTKRTGRMEVYTEQLYAGKRMLGAASDGMMASVFSSRLALAEAYSATAVAGSPRFGPLSNVWLGTSVESRKYLERITHLSRCPAAIRFLSLEPLLEDLGSIRGYLEQGIHWAIVGNESRGANVGRFADGYEAAARSLIQQCAAAGVACFHKQMPINGKTSGDPAEWPEDLRVRQMPAMEVPEMPTFI